MYVTEMWFMVIPKLSFRFYACSFMIDRFKMKGKKLLNNGCTFKVCLLWVPTALKPLKMQYIRDKDKILTLQ